MREDPQPGPTIPPMPGVSEAPSPAGARTLLKLPPSIWLKVVPAFALAAVSISLVTGKAEPRFPPGTVPPLRTMFLIALLVSGLTAAALYWCVTRDLGLAPRIALFAVAYNVLVVLVKFVLAPRGLYEVNRSRDLQTILPVSSTSGAVLTGVAVLLLYLAGYVLIFQVIKRRLGALAPRRTPKPARSKGMVIASVVVFGLLLLAPGAAIFLMLLGSGFTYLGFVFSSAGSLLIALVLAGAASLAAVALGSVADRAKLVGDAAVLVGFFWLGLWFLALYQVLWVVYILVITSIWPLKVVVPK